MKRAGSRWQRRSPPASYRFEPHRRCRIIYQWRRYRHESEPRAFPARAYPPPEASRCQNGGWHAATTPDKTEGGPAREPDSAIQWPLDTGANTFGRPSLARPKIVLSWWLSLIIDRVFELLLETSPFLPRTTVEIGDEKWRWREKSKETVRNFRSMVNFEICTSITNFLFSRLQAKWELFILFKWTSL